MTDDRRTLPIWPTEGQCFLCNEQIDFFSDDEWGLSLSFSGAPREATKPSRLFYAHQAYIEKAKHLDYVMITS
jgi:hypothetical protein